MGRTGKVASMPDPIEVKCPSCDQKLAAANESGLVNVLREHLYEEHALEMPPERVRENVAAQLRDFDDYNARPISGASGSPGLRDREQAKVG
jgi:hypothetical protein